MQEWHGDTWLYVGIAQASAIAHPKTGKTARNCRSKLDDHSNPSVTKMQLQEMELLELIKLASAHVWWLNAPSEWMSPMESQRSQNVNPWHSNDQSIYEKYTNSLGCYPPNIIYDYSWWLSFNPFEKYYSRQIGKTFRQASG